MAALTSFIALFAVFAKVEILLGSTPLNSSGSLAEILINAVFSFISCSLDNTACFGSLSKLSIGALLYFIKASSSSL